MKNSYILVYKIYGLLIFNMGSVILCTLFTVTSSIWTVTAVDKLPYIFETATGEKTNNTEEQLHM